MAQRRWPDRHAWTRATRVVYFAAVGVTVLTYLVITTQRSTDFEDIVISSEPVVLAVILPEGLYDELIRDPQGPTSGDLEVFRTEIDRHGLEAHGMILRRTTSAPESPLEDADLCFIPFDDLEAFVVIGQVSEVIRAGRYGAQRIPPRLVPAPAEELAESTWERRWSDGEKEIYIDLINKARPGLPPSRGTSWPSDR